MTYKWILSGGIVEKPVHIPIEYFTSKFRVDTHKPNFFPPGRILAYGKVTPFLDTYYISRALFETKNLDGAVLGDSSGKIIATYHYDWLHIEQEHRGKRLAIEFMTEALQVNIHRFIMRKGANNTHLNSAGAYILERCRELLVERRAITHEI